MIRGTGPLDSMHMQWSRGPSLIPWPVAGANLNIWRRSSNASLRPPALAEHQSTSFPLSSSLSLLPLIGLARCCPPLTRAACLNKSACIRLLCVCLCLCKCWCQCALALRSVWRCVSVQEPGLSLLFDRDRQDTHWNGLLGHVLIKSRSPVSGQRCCQPVKQTVNRLLLLVKGKSLALAVCHAVKKKNASNSDEKRQPSPRHLVPLLAIGHFHTDYSESEFESHSFVCCLVLRWM